MYESNRARRRRNVVDPDRITGNAHSMDPAEFFANNSSVLPQDQLRPVYKNKILVCGLPFILIAGALLFLAATSFKP